jgi:hypothetical protein
VAYGIAWDDAQTALEAPGVEIRRVDHGGLAMCLIRLDEGSDTRPLFKGLPDDECQCHHWGHIISGTMLVRNRNGEQTYEAGETYYWAPGHNLEALTDAEYVELSPSDRYDELMAHCVRAMGSA